VAGVSSPPKALEQLPAQFLFYGLLFLALAAMLRMQYDRPFWRSLGFDWPSFPLWPIPLIGAATAMGLAALGGVLKIPATKNPMVELLADASTWRFVAAFGTTIAPVCEEAAFRGFLQPRLARSFGALAGVLLPAALFGLVHLPQYGYSWQQALIVSLAGAGFGWMRQASGSTAAAALMHAAYNGTLFLGASLAG
ncbi:MAG: lysostaphin resistance A-like protein, partial [Bryobacteraceae bacterium]